MPALIIDASAIQLAMDTHIEASGEPRTYAFTGATRAIDGGALCEFSTEDPDIPANVWVAMTLSDPPTVGIEPEPPNA